MANIKSAIKRIRTAERNRLRNKSYKSAVKTLSKKAFEAIEACATEPSDETKAEAQKCISVTFSKIDKAVKTGVYHRNTAARKKSRLAREFKQAATAATAI